MNNDKLLLNLNDKTKDYLDASLSYLDFYTKSIDEGIFSKKDLIAISFLLPLLLEYQDFEKIFSKYNLGFSDLTSHIDDLIDDDEDVDFKDCRDTDYYKKTKLYNIFENICGRIKCNNINDNIKLTDIEPYQIFDYIFDEYFDSFEKIFKEYSTLDGSFEELMEDIYNRISNYNNNFVVGENNIISFIFNDCEFILKNNELFVIFTKDVNNLIVVNYDKEKHPISPNTIYRVKEMCGYKNAELNSEYLNKIFNNTNILDCVTIYLSELHNPDNKFKVTLNGQKLFSNKQENNGIQLSDINVEKNVGQFTPNLDKYGFDLTKEKYVKDPSVKRDDKIKEIEKILLYPEKDKSVIITGEAGCGKTALVQGFAYRIQKEDVPEELKKLRIYSIDTTTLVAGTRYAGTLEEKMKNIFDEASSSKNIILFFDEIHRTLGAGKTEGDDNTISEMLKPYLDGGKIRVIGATTNDDYNKYLLEDDAFRTRFKRIKIAEPTDDVIYDIVNNLIDSYNKFSFSKLVVSDEERDNIIINLLEATKHRHYLDSASNPRLILDIIKDAYALAALDNRTEVTRDDIATSLMGEEKIYKSTRETYAKKIRNNVYEKKLCKIINFNDYANKN